MMQLARLARRARLRPAQQLALARLVLVAFLGCLALWARRALLALLAQPVVIALPV